MKKIILFTLFLSTIFFVINRSKTESISYNRKLIIKKKIISISEAKENKTFRKKIKNKNDQPLLEHARANTTIKDQEERIEDDTYDIQWLNKEWDKYLDIVLREHLKLNQQKIENYYKNKKIYSDQFNHTSQLIEESNDVQNNMERMIQLQKDYEKKRNNILGIKTVKIINQQYIKKFNDENSYFTRNNTKLSSF